MKSRWAKFVIIVALSLYLGGPLFETVDRWDNFKDGKGDIVLSLTGAVSLLAAAIGFAIAKFRELRADRTPFRVAMRFLTRLPGQHAYTALALPSNFHSPPTPLRV